MSSQETVGVGVIGYGQNSAARTFHVPLIGVEPRLELRAVAARNIDFARETLPDCRVTASADELIHDPRVDLVVVATPNASHFEFAKRALFAGKHTVVEKPLTNTVAEADQLIAIARSKRRLVSQFHNRRWDGGMLTVKKILAEGTLGDPVTYEANYDRWEPIAPDNWRTEQALGAGALYDLGTHLLDQMLVLSGRPLALSATIRTLRRHTGADDYFNLQLDYGNFQARLGANLLAADPGPRYKLCGKLGTLTKYGIDRQALMLNAGILPGDPGWGEDAPADYGTLYDGSSSRKIPTEVGRYQDFYAGIAASILDGEPLPAAVEDARDTLALITAAFRSNAEGRRIPSQEMDLLALPKIM